MTKVYRRTTKIGQRLRMLLGIGALAAMTTFGALLGGWSISSGSTTTLNADRASQTATPSNAPSSNAPSVAPKVKAPPFTGGWSGGGPFHGGGWPGP